MRGGQEEGDQVGEEEGVGHVGPEQRNLVQHYDTDDTHYSWLSIDYNDHDSIYFWFSFPLFQFQSRYSV